MTLSRDELNCTLYFVKTMQMWLFHFNQHGNEIFEVLVFSAEDEDSMFLRNAGIYLRIHTASQPRRTSATW
jgi:hypothetical protein